MNQANSDNRSLVNKDWKAGREAGRNGAMPGRMTRKMSHPVRTSCALALVAAAMSATLSRSTHLVPKVEARATPYGSHGISLGLGGSADRKRRRTAKYEVDMDDLLDGGANDDSGARRGSDGDSGQSMRRREMSVYGTGREFDIFDTRGGETSRPTSAGGPSSSLPSRLAFPPSDDATGSKKRRKKRSSNSSYSPSSTRDTASSEPGANFVSALRSFRDNLPRIQLRMEPTTTLKIRKTFRIFKATMLRLGADFNYQLGVWQFRSSWEDTVIGGKLSLVGRELQLAKTWRLSVDKSSLGAQEDFVTSVRFRAAVDLSTLKAYARLGFRTERISPINVYEGFTFIKRIPLDGKNENIKLEIKANFALPEPEIEYSTENHRTFVGLGDVEVNVDEMNLLFDF